MAALGGFMHKIEHNLEEQVHYTGKKAAEEGAARPTVPDEPTRPTRGSLLRPADAESVDSRRSSKEDRGHRKSSR